MSEPRRYRIDWNGDKPGLVEAPDGLWVLHDAYENRVNALRAEAAKLRAELARVYRGIGDPESAIALEEVAS